MRTALTHIRLLTLLLHLRAFARWYVWEQPLWIVRRYREYATVFAEIFSFRFLLRTFFSPWKNIVDRYPAHGFQIGLIAQAFVLNCTSRLIGMIFRTVALLLGVVVECALFFAALLYLVFWVSYPVIIVTGVLFIRLSILQN